MPAMNEKKTKENNIRCQHPNFWLMSVASFVMFISLASRVYFYLVRFRWLV